MTTEKQIQAAVTKYRALMKEKEKLEQKYRVQSVKFNTAKRALDETSKKMTAWAKKSIEFDNTLKKKGILKEVEKRVYGD